ncbi:hypothetical protein EV1_013925 [Malus domestica]
MCLINNNQVQGYFGECAPQLRSCSHTSEHQSGALLVASLLLLSAHSFFCQIIENKVWSGYLLAFAWFSFDVHLDLQNLKLTKNNS